MFTNFQRKKIEHHFNIIDFNQDGVLTQDDLYNHGQEYANLIKVPTKDYIAKEIEWWNKMNEVLNIKQERSLTSSDHMKAFEIVMSTSCFLPVFLWDYIELIWESLQLQKTQGIHYERFAGVMVAEEGIEAKEIFDLLDTEKKGTLYMHELYYYWVSYFYSNNPNCPSKWVFGKNNA
jgi:Ca2+-binding EF-hand superfamily protein